MYASLEIPGISSSSGSCPEVGSSCAKVASVPNHLESASPQVVATSTLRNEGLSPSFSWALSPMRVESSCRRDPPRGLAGASFRQSNGGGRVAHQGDGWYLVHNVVQHSLQRLSVDSSFAQGLKLSLR